MTRKPPTNRGDGQPMTDAYNDESFNEALSGVLQTRLGKASIVLAFIVLICGGLLLGTVLAPHIGAGPSEDPGSPTVPETPDTPDEVVVSQANYSSVYANVTPSIVSIYANRQNGTSSQGSGFVYDSSGHIVTNWHVIDGGEEFYVRYSNGEWSNATVVGSDPYTDLAVLSVESRPDSADPLPVSNELPGVGTEVVAIGSPDNLRGSMSTGIVSGVNRSMTTPQGYVIPDMVQTDAALNPGNSGGPLVTLDGTVTGLNRARQGENIGFAVSGRLMNTIIPSLIKDGTHSHSMVGIRGTTMSPTIAQANDIPLRNGILVTEVASKSPADGVLEGAGGEMVMHNGVEVYKGGDLITEVDGSRITTNEGLTSYLMRETSPGDTVEFTIIRGGEEMTVDVTLGERPPYGG